jgi:hypothetical protein
MSNLPLGKWRFGAKKIGRLFVKESEIFDEKIVSTKLIILKGWR